MKEVVGEDSVFDAGAKDTGRPSVARARHPADGMMRVWWIPQVPGKPFHAPVCNTAQALYILDTLARYDQFQLDNNIKPDYCNCGGLEIHQDGDWQEWEDDEGNNIDDLGRLRRPFAEAVPQTVDRTPGSLSNTDTKSKNNTGTTSDGGEGNG